MPVQCIDVGEIFGFTYLLFVIQVVADVPNRCIVKVMALICNYYCREPFHEMFFYGACLSFLHEWSE